MGNGSPVRVSWYGERGIVNAAVMHVTRQPNPVLLLRSLLDSIQWADERKPSWIGQVVEADFLIEVSAGDFGNPDLIIVCRAQGESQPYCLFVEAKAVPYTWSMMSISGGMQPGFNSSINGQLTLKYRLARALTAADPMAHDRDLVESQATFCNYRERLGDTLLHQRHVMKPSVCRMFGDHGLIGLREERFCYVALTWDTTGARPDHCWFRDPSVGPEYRPLFLSDRGDDQWHEMQSRVGWLGIQEMAQALGLASDPDFLTTVRTMQPELRPAEDTYRRGPGMEGLTPEERETMDCIANLLASACGGVIRGAHSSSTSLSIARCAPPGEVLAKVVAESGRIFVGARGPAAYGEAERSINGVRFRGGTIATDDPAPADSPVLAAVAAELARGIVKVRLA